MEATEGWRGRTYRGNTFEAEDIPVLETVLDLIPDLRVCAIALRQSRRVGLTYPIESGEQLGKLLDPQQLQEAGMAISQDDLRRFVREEYFPMEHEGELVSGLYMGLVAARQELHAASGVDEVALERLKRATSP